MKIQKNKSLLLKDITVIAALPDMGRVGGLVTQHISKNLPMELAYKITVMDKPWINQKDGIITTPIDEYSIFVNKENSIVVVTGNNQPQEPKTVFELTSNVISCIKEMGNITRIISAGGYLPQNSDEGNNVYGIVTNEELIATLKKNDIKILGSEVNSITWFNGLILGKAKNLGIDGIGLFGEILDANTPQFQAASNVVKKIVKITNVEIPTKELEDKIPKEPPKKEPRRPGIG
ncbi:MAG: PAC2 family protein [Nitrosopumilaceae archaeon]|nr:PAC2 family protein [Nitrosopumilaceae archaeon]